VFVFVFVFVFVLVFVFAIVFVLEFEFVIVVTGGISLKFAKSEASLCCLREVVLLLGELVFCLVVLL